MASELIYNVSINLSGQEIRNAKAHILATAPAGAEALTYYDSVLKTIRFHNGQEWVPMDARLATNIPLSALATDPLARANHTGTQLAATISDFHAQVRTSRLDQMAVPTMAVSFNNVRITDLANPTGLQDAATKAYVDSASISGNAASATKLQTARAISLTGVITAAGVNFDGTSAIALNTAISDGALSIAKTSGLQTALNSKQASLGYTPLDVAGDEMQGTLTLAADPINPMEAATKQYVDLVAQSASAGIDPKEAVRVATTENITLSGLQTIDTVALVAGDFVLVKNQAVASQNGIYIVSSTSWIRRSDAVQGKLTQGALVLVVDGNANKGQQWYLQTNDPITVGSTSLSWIQFNATTAYTASNGVQLVGGDFSIKATANGGLIANSSGLAVDTAVVTRKYVSGPIGDGSTKDFTITHNLNTQDVTVAVRNLGTNDIEMCGITNSTVNAVTVSFGGNAPAANSYKVIVTG